MKKSLLYIANVRMPTEKAHGVQIMQMCAAFASTGVDVTLVAPKRKTPIIADPFAYYGTAHTFEIVKLPCIDTASWGRIGFYVQLLSFSLSSLWYALRRRDALLYGRNVISLFFLQLCGRSTIWEVHTKEQNPCISWYVGRGGRLIVISAGLRDWYRETYHILGDILIAPDGVDFKRFTLQESKEEVRKRLGLPVEKKVIGYIGKFTTMGRGKGVEALVEAFERVHASRRDTHLLLVGANPEELGLIKQQEGVTVFPHRPYADIPAYLHACDILVMNYPAEEHYARFMSPLKLFEYMAAGVPVATSDLPAVREIVNEAEVFFYSPEDIAALAHVLMQMLASPQEAGRRAAAAREKVKTYTWEARAAAILLLF